MAEFYRKKKKVCQMCAGKDVDYNFSLTSFDGYLGDSVREVLLLDEGSNLVIFQNELGEVFFVCIPLSIPSADDANSHSMRINFLSHCYLASLVSRITVMWLVRLLILYALPLETGLTRLRIGPPSAKISAT